MFQFVPGSLKDTKLPLNLKWLWKPMLLASVGLHALLLGLPIGEHESRKTEANPSPVKLTTIAGQKSTPKPLPKASPKIAAKPVPQVAVKPAVTQQRQLVRPMPPILPVQPSPQPSPSPQPTTPAATSSPAATPAPATSGPTATAPTAPTTPIDSGTQGDPTGAALDPKYQPLMDALSAAFTYQGNDGNTYSKVQAISPVAEDFPQPEAFFGEKNAGVAGLVPGGFRTVDNTSAAEFDQTIEGVLQSQGVMLHKDSPYGGGEVYKAEFTGNTAYINVVELKPAIGKPYTAIILSTKHLGK